MRKVWKSITLVISVALVLALVAVLTPMGENVHADNVTSPWFLPEGEGPAAAAQVSVCNNTNDGGVMDTGPGYVLIDVDCWHNGPNPGCWICDELADYSITKYGGYSGSCWLSPCPFADPVPKGNIVTNIDAKINGKGSTAYGGNGLARLYINGMLVGTGLLKIDLSCGPCDPLVLTSQIYPAGFPGYVYGGTNQLGLSIEGYSAISDVHLRLYYHRATLPPSSLGKPGVSPSTPGGWARPLKPANMSTQVLSINPQQTYANQPVTITTNVVNTGDEGGNYNVALKINGQVEETRMVSVGPLGTQPVKFTVSKAEPGTYTVAIDRHQSNFTVLGTSSTGGGSNVAVPIIAVSLLVIIGAVLVMMVRRSPA